MGPLHPSNERRAAPTVSGAVTKHKEKKREANREERSPSEARQGQQDTQASSRARYRTAQTHTQRTVHPWLLRPKRSAYHWAHTTSATLGASVQTRWRLRLRWTIKPECERSVSGKERGWGPIHERIIVFGQRIPPSWARRSEGASSSPTQKHWTSWSPRTTHAQTERESEAQAKAKKWKTSTSS